MLFFSYSRANLLVVRSVAAELRRLGHRTWIDLEDLRPGERWREAIERAMAASDAMVFCISRLSLDSAWTSVELRAAHERGLPVVPMLVDDVAIVALPPTLRDMHLIATAGWDRHTLPARAALAIARCVKPAASWAAPDAACCVPAAPALRVDLSVCAGGGALLGWDAGVLPPAPAAPMDAHALRELARAADEVHAADVHVQPGLAAASAALVLGALAARLGPARVRLHADACTARALAEPARCLKVTVVDTSQLLAGATTAVDRPQQGAASAV